MSMVIGYLLARNVFPEVFARSEEEAEIRMIADVFVRGAGGPKAREEMEGGGEWAWFDPSHSYRASGVLEAPANNHIQRTADAGAMDGPPPMEVRRVQTGSRAFFDGKGPPGAAFDPRWVR